MQGSSRRTGKRKTSPCLSICVTLLPKERGFVRPTIQQQYNRSSNITSSLIYLKTKTKRNKNKKHENLLQLPLNPFQGNKSDVLFFVNIYLFFCSQLTCFLRFAIARQGDESDKSCQAATAGSTTGGPATTNTDTKGHSTAMNSIAPLKNIQ